MAATLISGSAVTLAAHDFWLVPNAFQIAAGDTVVAYGQTSSRFPTSESAVATDRVAEARLIGPANSTPIRDLSVENKSLRLRARPDAPGQYVIAARLNWRSTRESAESFRRYLRLEGAPEAAERLDREGLLRGRDSVTRRYAKYAKTFVQVGNGAGRTFSIAAGHPLELIPEKDPASLRVGDTLNLRLVFQGKPVSGAQVHMGAVRWDSRNLAEQPAETAKDFHVTADAAGVVRVPIVAGGLWNVRTIHIAQSPAGAGADWDTHWATIVFLVGESPGTPSTRSSDSADVARVVQAYDEALRKGDSTGALALLAEDAVILESGGVETRAEYRSHHLAGDVAYARAVSSQSGSVNVKVVGDVAWAWSTSTTQGTYRDRPVNSVGAELMVLTRSANGWRVRAIHWSSRARRP